MMEYSSSFSSFGAYGRAVLRTPTRLRKSMWAVWSPAEELTEIRARSGAEMQRKLRWYDLVAMGVGGMVGAGIFVSTGSAAKLYAGPSVIVAYIVAGFSALLSALCYTEFAVEMPVAGGAFSYLRITFGEFAAYLAGANLIAEYVLSNAAVARSFTSYLATVFGVVTTDAWRLRVQGLGPGYDRLDFSAVAILIMLTLFLCYSTKDSSTLNMVMTIFHLSFIIFIIIAGFAKGNISNLTKPGVPSVPGGFFPYGVKGVFNGAAIVYFSFIGYDAVSTLAEEVQEPAKNMPIGVAGSVVIVSVLYCLMAASICMLLPYDMIDPEAPFSTAFKHVAGWKWATNLVGVGATLGIVTSLLVSMLGQARYLCVIGRANLIPCWFAKVSPTTGTPINATIFLGCCTAGIALFTELDVLLNLVSIGTLFVFYLVANALIFRRHVVAGGVTNPWPTALFLALLSVSAIGFVAAWGNNFDCWWGLMISGGMAIGFTTVFWMRVPVVQKGEKWEAPLMPFLAAASIFLNVFLLGSVDRKSYKRFGIWSGIAVCFYVVYSVHATYDAEARSKDESSKIDLEQLHTFADKSSKFDLKQTEGLLKINLG
ncbi:hypothetical protein O6H91_16G011400 [Diphasiastrum complanatum]|uniref:Uncharacterized protein n=4 Tax=Diphasiastrum complanatum TaxID=34168 RepID=A0ACC2B9U2_DIPCM|nr:hypothetical protein O6H91_16G011400 [Diphasiastrum complanatum]KAJ7526546.1 hypothetical protein O6H91_16G011400 [Diphasiastrum complanatum]KAJ7526547.1 hypothetical protein O6H91_16G011400 [Diphasiastrum complanatum]KAJ7526548.1 hypothetical protein O6H91_16G011400 [Diphasiastrum complanatum]